MCLFLFKENLLSNKGFFQLLLFIVIRNMQRIIQQPYELESDSDTHSSYEKEPLYNIPSSSQQKNGHMNENIKNTKTNVEEIEPVYPKPTQEELDEFKGQLDEWVRLEDQIRKLNIAKRERLLRLKALGNLSLIHI